MRRNRMKVEARQAMGPIVGGIQARARIRRTVIGDQAGVDEATARRATAMGAAAAGR